MRSLLLDRLEGCRRILLAGAGGGYDIFAGLPLYFWLAERGIEVCLANLTFSDLSGVEGKRHSRCWMEVDASCIDGRAYFPEAFLCRWFRVKRGQEISIHCFERLGVVPLKNAYQLLCDKFKPDAIVLVDGGTDSLMRGDEVGLGTPSEDIASLLAAAATDVEQKYLACVGFGVDTFHGVCHADFLQAVAELSVDEAFLGTFSLLPQQSEFQEMKSACGFVFDMMPEHVSIVNSSIISSVEGRFGDFHATRRTRGSELFINPLMGIFWGFELEAVVRRCLYAEQVARSENWGELLYGIEKFRATVTRKTWKELPM